MPGTGSNKCGRTANRHGRRRVLVGSAHIFGNRIPHHWRVDLVYFPNLPAPGSGKELPMSISDLPALNAGLNATATLLLAAGYICIKSDRKIAHRNCMASAFVVSCIFLTTYVIHKILMHGIHTPFGGSGFWRPFYYGMLISHIFLAILILPLVLITIRHAVSARYERHRQWARWTFPIWMYVSVTGVLVYFMLYQWFPKV